LRPRSAAAYSKDGLAKIQWRFAAPVAEGPSCSRQAHRSSRRSRRPRHPTNRRHRLLWSHYHARRLRQPRLHRRSHRHCRPHHPFRRSPRHHHSQQSCRRHHHHRLRPSSQPRRQCRPPNHRPTNRPGSLRVGVTRRSPLATTASGYRWRLSCRALLGCCCAVLLVASTCSAVTATTSNCRSARQRSRRRLAKSSTLACTNQATAARCHSDRTQFRCNT